MTFEDSSYVTSFYDAINEVQDIRQLIIDGVTEGQHLEAKNTGAVSNLNKPYMDELARVVSGFANAGGGVLMFGVKSTPKHGHDQLTDMEPIGAIKTFKKKLEMMLPLALEPMVPLTNEDCKREAYCY